MTDPIDNQMDNTLFGGTINPYLRCNSYSRVSMASQQIPQTATLLESDLMQISTDVPADLAECVWDIRAPCDLEVITILNKYTANAAMGDVKNSVSYIIYQEANAEYGGKVGVIEVPTFHTKHVQFGFKYVFTETYLNLREGQFLNKGTILATSPGVSKEGNYGFGREANFAFISELITHEDGVGMNEGAREFYKTRIFKRTSTLVSKDTILLNTFGDDNNYQPFPRIGEKVRDDGLLMVMRKLRKDYLPLQINKHALRNECPVYDSPKHVTPGSVVEDITIIRNPFVKKTQLPEALKTFLDKYAENHEVFYQQIRKLDKHYRRTQGNHYQSTPQWHRLCVNAEKFNLETISPKGGNSKPIPYFDKQAIDEYQIIIDTSVVIMPTVGFKFTDLQGGKFVVCGFKSWEDSPTDKWGRKAWFWANPSSVSNRNNPGQLVEMQHKDACFQTRETLLAMKERGESLEVMWEYLLGFYQLVSSDTLRLVSMLDTNATKQMYLDDIFKSRIGLYMEPDSEDATVTSCIRLKGTPYEPKRFPITIGVDGKKITTKLPIQIANKYIIMLEKIGNYPAAVTTPKRTIIGVASKLSTEEKKASQISEQAQRFGESEMRNLFASRGFEVAAYFAALANSPAQHKAALRNKLRSTEPAKVDNSFVYDEAGNILPPDVSQGSKIFGHYLNCFGVELTNE